MKLTRKFINHFLHYFHFEYPSTYFTPLIMYWANIDKNSLQLWFKMCVCVCLCVCVCARARVCVLLVVFAGFQTG